MGNTFARSTRIVLLALLTLAAGAFQATAAAPAAGRPVVTDIRIGIEDNRTRLVLDMTEQVTARVFTLEGPPRVVIDLPEVGWRLPQRPLPSNQGLLGKVRYGLFKPGTTRVVLDLAREATIDSVFVLVPPGGSGEHRLVIDLAPEAPDAFHAGIDKLREVAVYEEGAAPSQSPPAAGLSAPAATLPPPAVLGTPQPVRTRVAAVTPPPPPPAAPRKRVVVIDPGHGGADPGAISVSGTYEKHVTLATARELKAVLEKSGKYKVLLTRERDVFIRLQDRVAFAREAGGDLFISLHADAMADPSIRGLSIYTLSQKASDNLAEQLAERENKADLIGGVDLSRESAEVSNILLDLAQRETMNQSSRFATLTVAEMGRSSALLRNAHRFASFVVLKSPDIPSVLVELGFLSNVAEEKALRTKAYRQTLATGIAAAVDRFFAQVEEAHNRR